MKEKEEFNFTCHRFYFNINGENYISGGLKTECSTRKQRLASGDSGPIQTEKCVTERYISSTALYNVALGMYYSSILNICKCFASRVRVGGSHIVEFWS